MSDWNELASLFTEKRLILFISIQDGKILTQIAKNAKMTYSHVIKLLYLFEDKGLVTMQKEGRKKVIKMTNKGRELKNKLIELKEVLQ